MNIEEAGTLIWDSMQEDIYYPDALKGKLTLDEAYRIQLNVLERWVEAGEKHAGWKIGLTAEALRKMFNSDAPIFGYLLESRRFQSGQTFQFEEIISPSIESEIYFTLNKRIQGPDVTKEQVVDAVELIAPAFEIVSLRGDMAADLALGVTDNVSQWGYVTGTEIYPYPQDLDLGEVIAEVTTNGTPISQGRGVDVIDNQLESIAKLANHLSKYGMALEAGHSVMTGSFTKPLPITQGDRWETRFSPIGNVSASFL